MSNSGAADSRARRIHPQNKRGTEDDMNVGRHSKDITDAMSGACYHMFQDITKHTLDYNYDDINRLLNQQNTYRANEPITDFEKEHLYQSLMDNIKRVRGKRDGAPSKKFLTKWT